MNKKILSLAIAAAVAAPMSAMADVSVNGAVARDLYNDSTLPNSLYGNDFGTSKLEFNVKEGDSFAKIAFDIRASGFGGTTMPSREQYAGIKVGGVDVIVGRQASTYAGTLKVDAMTANFLEARKNAGGVSKVPSFESGMLGVGGKAGDVSYMIQYGIADPTNARLQAGVSFKAGPVNVGVAYHSDSSGEASYGLAGKMKFGDIAVGVSLESADGYWTSTGAGGTGNKESIVFADVAMPMGSGTLGLGLGDNTTQSTTFARLSYAINVSKATVTFGGRTSDGDTRTGVNLTVKF